MGSSKLQRAMTEAPRDRARCSTCRNTKLSALIDQWLNARLSGETDWGLDAFVNGFVVSNPVECGFAQDERLPHANTLRNHINNCRRSIWSQIQAQEVESES